MKSSLIGLLFVVAAASLATAYFFYSRQQTLAVDLARLRVEVAEVSRLRAENEELTSRAAPPAEVERLKKESAEVHKLRNEVRQLRKEKDGVTQQLQQTQQAALASAAQSLPPGSAEEELQRLRTENQQLHQENETFHMARVQAQSNTCIANLKQLDGAMAQWALENRKAVGDVPRWEDLVGASAYIRKPPVCPGGGQYTVPAMGQFPTCNIPGHQLPP